MVHIGLIEFQSNLLFKIYHQSKFVLKIFVKVMSMQNIKFHFKITFSNYLWFLLFTQKKKVRKCLRGYKY